MDSGGDVTAGAFIDVKKLNERRKSTARTLEPSGEEDSKKRCFFTMTRFLGPKLSWVCPQNSTHIIIFKTPDLFVRSGRSLMVRIWVGLVIWPC